MRPTQIELSAGQRCRIVEPVVPPSFNCLSCDRTAGRRESDLHDSWPLTALKDVELTPEGDAELDIYVYSVEGFGADRSRELETNVRAHVRLVDGKPRIWKMTASGGVGPLILI